MKPDHKLKHDLWDMAAALRLQAELVIEECEAISLETDPAELQRMRDYGRCHPRLVHEMLIDYIERAQRHIARGQGQIADALTMLKLVLDPESTRNSTPPHATPQGE